MTIESDGGIGRDQFDPGGHRVQAGTGLTGEAIQLPQRFEVFGSEVRELGEGFLMDRDFDADLGSLPGPVGGFLKLSFSLKLQNQRGGHIILKPEETDRAGTIPVGGFG